MPADTRFGGHCYCAMECTECARAVNTILKLKNTGLVVYRHVKQTKVVDNATGILDCDVRTTEDVYILHNTKDRDMTSDAYGQEIENTIVKCPRCRKFFEDTQRLLLKGPKVKDVKGICEHCKMKRIPSLKSHKETFIDRTSERAKMCLSRIKELLEYKIGGTKEDIGMRRTSSELRFDQLEPICESSMGEQNIRNKLEPCELDLAIPIRSSREKNISEMVSGTQTDHGIDETLQIREPISQPEAQKDTTSQDDIAKKRKQDAKDTSQDDITKIRKQDAYQSTSQDDIAKKGKPDVKDTTLQDDIAKIRKQGAEYTTSQDDIAKIRKKDAVSLTPSQDDINKIRKYNSKDITSQDGTAKIRKLGAKDTSSQDDIPKIKIQDVKDTSSQDYIDKIRKQGAKGELESNISAKDQDLKPETDKTAQMKNILAADDRTKVQKQDVKEQLEQDAKSIQLTDNADKTEKEQLKSNKNDYILDKQVVQEDKTRFNTEKAAEKAAFTKEQDLQIKIEKTGQKAEETQVTPTEKNKIKAQDQDEKKLKADKDAQKAAILKIEKTDKNLKKEKIGTKLEKRKDREGIDRNSEINLDLGKLEKQYQKEKKESKKEIAKWGPKLHADTQKKQDILKTEKHGQKHEKITKEDKIKDNSKQEKELRKQKLTLKNDPKSILKKENQQKAHEVHLDTIKVQIPTDDDLIRDLIQIRRSTKYERVKPSAPYVDMRLPTKQSKDVKRRMVPKKTAEKLTWTKSEIALEVEENEINMLLDKGDVLTEIIIGPKIYPSRPEEKVILKKEPCLFKTEIDLFPLNENKDLAPPEKKRKDMAEDPEKRILRYSLSDRKFIDNGWTMLPTEKIVRKMNVYRMRPAHPEFDWFEHNKSKKKMQYDSGEKLAEFYDDGRGRWFYKNGRMALDYYDAEEVNAGQRFVIYSNGEPDERGRSRPYTLLATFDYSGNGIVFDHRGKIRLKYNQTEGVVLDRSIGPVSHWKWHTLNDPPVLQQVMIDTQMTHKDPTILSMGGDKTPRKDNEDMLAIEFDNFIKEKSKKLNQTFKPFQIKMKALKINEHFSLKILDQATVYLIYRDGTTNLKLNIGMILDQKEIVDTDTAEVGEVSNSMEKLPARTDSLAGLQKSVSIAQRYDRLRTERERALHPVAPSESADKLIAGISRPLRPPLRTFSSSHCNCSRKPTATSVYYDTRLG